MMDRFKITVLFLSGIALLYASSSRLITPTNAVFLATYFEDPANSLATHIDLVNEIRGIGAVMLLAGILAFISIFRANFRLSAFFVVTVILGGVVLGRSVSLLVDGIPPDSLLGAYVVEIVLSVLNIFCLARILTQHETLNTSSGFI